MTLPEIVSDLKGKVNKLNPWLYPCWGTSVDPLSEDLEKMFQVIDLLSELGEWEWE